MPQDLPDACFRYVVPEVGTVSSFEFSELGKRRASQVPFSGPGSHRIDNDLFAGLSLPSFSSFTMDPRDEALRRQLVRSCGLTKPMRPRRRSTLHRCAGRMWKDSIALGPGSAAADSDAADRAVGRAATNDGASDSIREDREIVHNPEREAKEKKRMRFSNGRELVSLIWSDVFCGRQVRSASGICGWRVAGLETRVGLIGII